MKRFTDLFRQIDQTSRTNDKVAALERYFRQAPPADAAWALQLLTGKRPKRGVTTGQLRQWASQVSGIPPWLIAACHASVGDLSETLALIVPSEIDHDSDMPLHELIDQRVLPLGLMQPAQQRQTVMRTWRELSSDQRFLYHKLIGGGFRIGASKTLVTRAAANVAGVDAAVMTHRLIGAWRPTAENYAQLMAAEDPADPARPYPFYLAHAIEDAAGIDLANPGAVLGDVSDWQIEWKWDGIRAQLIRRGRLTLLWSRGEERVGQSFPELIAMAQSLPDGTVIDGEILAWSGDRPMPFAALQKRLGRKDVEPMLFEPESPVLLMAYDLLEFGGADVRQRPLAQRRELLADVVARCDEPKLRLSPVLPCMGWPQVAVHKDQAREHGAEGVMIKRRTAPYGVGRRKGDWWKHKADPYTIDAVLIHAQQGSGQRAGLYTDYTFALWDHDKLTPVAKAYSGLTDQEIRQVDAFIKNNTVARQGPIRTVRPELVFEIAFEDVRESTRHKSGLAVRFPRIKRWRTDKRAADADHLQTLRNLLPG